MYTGGYPSGVYLRVYIGGCIPQVCTSGVYMVGIYLRVYNRCTMVGIYPGCITGCTMVGIYPRVYLRVGTSPKVGILPP